MVNVILFSSFIKCFWQNCCAFIRWKSYFIIIINLLFRCYTVKIENLWARLILCVILCIKSFYWWTIKKYSYINMNSRILTDLAVSVMKLSNSLIWNFRFFLRELTNCPSLSLTNGLTSFISYTTKNRSVYKLINFIRAWKLIQTVSLSYTYELINLQ